ncbi:MAG: hypothetical protein H6R33_283 [Actinobacteria bacterium]|nr:hypothetical protein [Actinomycetota bacterium]
MSRLLKAIPWVFLAVAVGAAGWVGWDVYQSYRTSRESAAATTTSAATTTTTTTTTTTAPPTTTTTTAPFFAWDGGAAPIGILDEGPFGPPEFAYALASGVVREIVKEEVQVASTAYQGWVAYVYFGDHPVSGEEVVGRILLGLDDPANPWPGGQDLIACFRIDGGLPPADPLVGGAPCPVDLAGDVAARLVVGRQYPFPLLVAADLGEVPFFFAREFALGVEGSLRLLAALRGEEPDAGDGFARVQGIYLPPPEACVEGDPACLDPGTTTTFPRAAGWYDSCEAVVNGLIDESLAMLRETAAVSRAVEAAQAGTDPWALVGHAARTWLVPRLDALVASADEVIAANPDIVSTIAANAFREAALPLRNQAVHLAGSVSPYPGGAVPEGWALWWAGWERSIQSFNDVLSRAPATAYNCSD